MMRALALFALTALLAACQPGNPEPQVRRAEPRVEPLSTVPANACWATDRVPPVTQTVFEETGTDGERVPREITVRPSEERLFAVPCPDQMQDDFVASLQRALTARGHYVGAVSGLMDAATEQAVRSFQAPQGLNSAILSLEGAQQLGLVPVPREAL